MIKQLLSIQFQHFQKRFLWHFHIPDLFHTFLSNLLFLHLYHEAVKSDYSGI